MSRTHDGQEGDRTKDRLDSCHFTTLLGIFASPSIDNNLLTGGLFPVELGYFIAGGIAGMISRTTTAPLDRLKVYLIAQTSPKEAAVHAIAKGSPFSAVAHFTRPLVDACKDLWQAGGIRSLFAGNGLNVAKVMPESAIKFGAYEAAKKAFARIDGSDPKHLHPTAQFMAGGIGGVVSQCIVYPLDTLKLYVTFLFERPIC